MTLVDWNETYSVDIKEIDDQHKKLVEFVNSLHDPLKSGKSKETIKEILDDLFLYTQYHFSTEEKYFDMYKYPDFKIHKEQHRDLTNKVMEFREKYSSGETILTIEVMNILRDWLHEHILGSDAKFGSFLKSNGLK